MEKKRPEVGARALYDHYTSVQWAGGSASEQASWLKLLTMALRRRDMGEPIEDTERSVSDWLDEWLKMKAVQLFTGIS